jgi:hypothetical protein
MKLIYSNLPLLFMVQAPGSRGTGMRGNKSAGACYCIKPVKLRTVGKFEKVNKSNSFIRKNLNMVQRRNI